MSNNDLAMLEAVMDALKEKQGIDPVVLDVRDRPLLVDYFVVVSGRTDRQLKGLSNAVQDVAAQFNLVVKPEGTQGMRWLLQDLGHIVVHFMLPGVRQELQLEDLWAEIPPKSLDPDMTG